MAKKRSLESAGEPEGIFKLAINGHIISGEQRGGRWTFRCDEWRDLEMNWFNATDLAGVAAAFAIRALASTND